MTTSDAWRAILDCTAKLSHLFSWALQIVAVPNHGGWVESPLNVRDIPVDWGVLAVQIRANTCVIMHIHTFIEPHEAVPEVSKSKVHITQNKHVPIEIDCDFLNTFHSISHATPSWCWLERRSKKNYSVLLRTVYYTSTTPYYKVLLQYYSVLQSSTPVLLCTTLYYKVLLQYYSVLQSTTPVLLCTTKYYKVLPQY